MFRQSSIKTSSQDGHNFVLIEDLIFIRDDGTVLRAKIGSTSDGASTPREIWNLIPPFGKAWFSFIMHDAAYRNTLEILRAESQTWEKITLDFGASNCLLRECMISQGMEFLEMETIFNAVCDFGKFSFARDRG
jgi:hypothetical protein